MIRYIVENKDTGEYANFAYESFFSGKNGCSKFHRIYFHADINRARKFKTRSLAEKSLEQLLISDKNYIVEEHVWLDVEEEMNLPGAFERYIKGLK